MPQDHQRRRKAAGPPRPTYLHPEDTDKVMAIVLALMSEVASLRQRIDTHERLALAGSVPTPSAVDAYRADSEAETARESWRESYIKRLLRVQFEEIEAGVAALSAVLDE
jgi:hypothetical protein